MSAGKEDKGALAEKLLADFLSDKVVAHYVYLNPKLNPEKELCDVLIVLKNKAIVLQVKNKKLTKDELYKDKDIKKNVGQCRGAARTLLNSGATYSLKNEAGIIDKVDLSLIDEVYCISVMHEDAAWFGFYDDSATQKVHIVNYGSLQKVFGELNTLPEFFKYLSDKEELLSSGKSIILSGGEEELFALWIRGERSYAKIQESDNVFATDGIYKDLLKDAGYKIKKAEDEKHGKYWDKLILTCQELGDQYKSVSDELADEDSLNRRLLGSAYGEFLGHAIRNANPNGRMTHYSASPYGEPRKLYIFLFWGDAGNPESRRNRKVFLELQSQIFVRKYHDKYKEIKTIIGIATDSVFTPESPFEFMRLDVTDDFIEHCKSKQELDGLAKQFNVLQGELKIGSVHEYEEGIEIIEE